MNIKDEYVKNLLLKQELKLTKEDIKLHKAIIKANDELYDTTDIASDKRKDFLKDYIKKSYKKIDEIEKELDLIHNILNKDFTIVNKEV